MSKKKRPSRDLRALARDESGATMVVGIFMAMVLVGIVYYVLGVGSTVLFRQHMQDASDAAAFSGAVVHARGMNLIAFLNLVMAAALAILFMLRMVAGFFNGLAGITLGLILFQITIPIPPAPVLRTVGRAFDAAATMLDPVVRTIIVASSVAQTAIKYAHPAAAQERVIRTGLQDYAPTTNFAIGWPIYDPLPVEGDTSDQLCNVAQDRARAILQPRINSVFPGLYIMFRFVSGTVNQSLRRLRQTYCGNCAGPAQFRRCSGGFANGRPKRMEGSGNYLPPYWLGENRFQIRALVTGSPPFDRDERGVEAATWNRPSSSFSQNVREMGRVSFAQAEWYFSGRRRPPIQGWLWSPVWTARLRRFRIPGLGLPSSCGGPCQVIGRIVQIDDLVVH